MSNCSIKNGIAKMKWVKYKLIKAIILINLLYGCCCCSRQQPISSYKTYSIEKALGMESEIVWLDSISDSISIIPLETSDEILMVGGGIYYLYNNLLFIVHSGLSSNQRVSVFDLSGKYLWDIGRRGPGPGEYNSILSPKGVFFNNDKVYLYDYISHAIFCYNTLNGKFIKKIQIPRHFFGGFTFIDQNVIAGFTGPGGIFTNSRIVFMNEDGVYIDSVSHYKPGVVNSHHDGGYFNYNGNKYIKESYYDTVFQVKKDRKLYPEYIIDAGKYAITYEDRLEFGEKFRNGKLVYVEFENDKYIIVDRFPVENRTYIFIEKEPAVAKKVRFYYSEETCRHFLKEKIYINPADYNNLPGVYLEPPKPRLVNDGSPTFRINNVSEDNTVWIGGETALDMDDNPVIVLVHLKK